MGRQMMENFTGIGGVIEALGGSHTALYVSAGSDTMPFSFLSEAFLARRGVAMLSPDAYVFVDREKAPGRLGYADKRTAVETSSIRKVSVGGHPAAVLDVLWRDLETGDERHVPVARIRASNQDAFGICQRDGWTPETVVAVCDGCAHGFQDPLEGRGGFRCENDLDDETTALAFLPGTPRWWITDHFRPMGGSVRPGEGFASRAFPVGFRKVALLSSDWGHPWEPLNGATAFEVTAL